MFGNKFYRCLSVAGGMRCCSGFHCLFFRSCKQEEGRIVKEARYTDMDSDELPDLPEDNAVEVICIDDEDRPSDHHEIPEGRKDEGIVKNEGDTVNATGDGIVKNKKKVGVVIPLGYNPITGEIYHNQMADPDVDLPAFL